MNCPLELINGVWTCQQCGWIFARKGEPILSDKPPRRACPKSGPQKIERGPGTELKKLLRKLRIKVKVGCKCTKRAKLMDQKGPEWCKKNIELIVDWLEEEAEKRELPFHRILGKAVVKRAIRNAEKEERRAKRLAKKSV